jgi:fluoroacetyl-CoA thioesterase
MENNVLKPGLTGATHTRVTGSNVAKEMGSGDVEVFATPAMVALMEGAAIESIKPCLKAGETSVGVRIDVSHLAATPLSMKIRAEATLEKVDGRRLFFRVAAYDDKEKIGEGNHERVIVQRDRFLAKAQAKGS